MHTPFPLINGSQVLFPWKPRHLLGVEGGSTTQRGSGPTDFPFQTFSKKTSQRTSSSMPTPVIKPHDDLSLS